MLLALATGWHYWDRQKAINVAVDKIELAYKRELERKQNLSKATQDQLIRDNNEAIKNKNEQIQALNVDLDNALNKLRTRNTRPINYSPAPGITSTCSGAELFREDAEFLTREANRADQVIIERDYYYERYEDARNQLKQLSETYGKNNPP